MQQPENHISIAQLIALAESGATSETNAALVAHLEQCPLCDELFRYLQSALAMLDDASHAEHLHPEACPQTDMDYISTFLTLLRARPDSEAKTKLFRHFNECYPCCENFVSDWNNYLQIRAHS